MAFRFARRTLATVSKSSAEERTCFPATPIVSSTDLRLVAPSLSKHKHPIVFGHKRKRAAPSQSHNSSPDSASESYTSTWKTLISLERDHEKRSFTESSKKLGPSYFQNLVASFPPGPSHSFRIQLEHSSDSASHWPSLHISQPVSLIFSSSSENNPPPEKVDGRIHSISGRTLQLKLSAPLPPHLTRFSEYNISISPSFEEIIYSRMKQALNHLSNDPQSQREEILQELLSSPSPKMNSDPALSGTELSSLLLYQHPNNKSTDTQDIPDNTSDILDNFMIRSWALRYSHADGPLVMDGDPDLGLNNSQLRSIANSLLHRLSLVQGPPGTGKTKTIVGALHLLKRHFAIPHIILVCAPTNAVTDYLLESSLPPFNSKNNKQSHTSPLPPLNVLRLGHINEQNSDIAPFSLDHRLQNHPIMRNMESLIQEKARIQSEFTQLTDTTFSKSGELSKRNRNRSKTKGGGEKSTDEKERLRLLIDSLVAQSKSIAQKEWKLKENAIRDIYSTTDVVFSTCLGADSPQADFVSFPIVYIDEAAQASEPASLVPLMKGSRMLTLVGDHKQLSNIVSSPEARRGGFSLSLFERLKKNPLIPSTLLDTQYRMLPFISHFPNHMFYDGKLTDAPHNSLIPRSSFLVNPDIPITFIHNDSRERIVTISGGDILRTSVGNITPFSGGKRCQSSVSIVNIDEASLVCSIAEDLLVKNPTLKGSDIGIISPYAAQTQLIQHMLSRLSFSKLQSNQRRLEASMIEVATVDSYQGREKDVIIFSTVRSNFGGKIGFLHDARRLNVALTRAKNALFILGNADTLHRSGLRKPWFLSRGNSESVDDHNKNSTMAFWDVWRRYVYWTNKNGVILDVSKRNRRNHNSRQQHIVSQQPLIQKNPSISSSYNNHILEGTVQSPNNINAISSQYSSML